jgi:hypothetical protein
MKIPTYWYSVKRNDVAPALKKSHLLNIKHMTRLNKISM